MAALPIVEDIDGASAGLLAIFMSCWRKKRTHSDYIAPNGVPKRYVAGNGHKYVKEPCSTYAGNDNACGSKVRIVPDLVENREHLANIVSAWTRRKTGSLTF